MDVYEPYLMQLGFLRGHPRQGWQPLWHMNTSESPLITSKTAAAAFILIWKIKIFLFTVVVHIVLLIP